jgi:hypothetical protein
MEEKKNQIIDMEDRLMDIMVLALAFDFSLLSISNELMEITKNEKNKMVGILI